MHVAAPSGERCRAEWRGRNDLLYVFAIENAWAELPEEAMDMLDKALAAPSLCWPATLSFGQAPFPATVRPHPRHVGLRQRDPGLRALLASREAAATRGTFAGLPAQAIAVLPKLRS